MWDCPINTSNSDESKDKDHVEMAYNHIYFYSEVTRNSILKLNDFIRTLNVSLMNISNQYTTNEPLKIYLHINSYGGSIFAALAAVDVILNSKIDIVTIVEGCCASAGTLLSVLGKERQIRKHSYMLIHQLKSSFWGKMEEIKDEFENLNHLMDTIKSIYKERCNLPKKGKYSLDKRDIWLDSKKCLEYGLVDEIM